MLVDDALEIVQAAFAAKAYSYSFHTIANSKREKLRVIEAVGTPNDDCTTYISYDGLLVDAWEGLRDGCRLLPVVPVYRPKDQDGAFHAAWLLDCALSSGITPRPRTIMLQRGHSPTLPHLRFDFPHPWEQGANGPFQIQLGDLLVAPVMAYSVSDAEAKLQVDEGPDALEALFEKKRTNVFNRSRKCTLTARTRKPA